MKAWMKLLNAGPKSLRGKLPSAQTQTELQLLPEDGGEAPSAEAASGRICQTFKRCQMKQLTWVLSTFIDKYLRSPH